MREESFKLKHDMFEKQQRLMFKVTLQLMDGVIGDYSYDEERHQEELKKAGVEKSTNNHIAIFECSIRPPPTMTLMNCSLIEYINTSRINFRDWKIVDFDNYMKGNPPYKDFLKRVKFEENLQAYEDTKFKSKGFEYKTVADC